MKIIDKYILKSFASTLFTVFIILFFIFVLQAIWLFISELAGKDLDLLSILKFLVFYSPKIIPLVLPLSILLSSIMTFGSLAESYEFAAMKSSGISLIRASRVLSVFVLMLSILAFIFANNIIPKAEFNFLTLRTSFAQQKPSMLISEGQFSDVGDFYNIKVEEKYGKEETQLKDVTIHKKAPYGNGISVIIKAKSGEIVASEKSNFLQLILYDGNYYEDIMTKNASKKSNNPFAKSSFEKYIINFDLKPLNKQDNNMVITTSSMFNISELRYTLDSLERTKFKNKIAYQNNINGRFSYYLKKVKDSIKIKENKETNSLLDLTSLALETKKDTLFEATIDTLLYTQKIRANDSESRLKILEIAKNNALNVKYTLESSKGDMNSKIKNINEHELALYDKFVVAYACLLLFFIGAPLGAIIKKGGVGLPIVFAIVIFIAFHFTNVFGKKLAQESGISTFLGSWLSSIFLTPLALLLLHRATNDIELINIGAIWQKLKILFNKNQKK